MLLIFTDPFCYGYDLLCWHRHDKTTFLAEPEPLFFLPELFADHCVHHFTILLFYLIIPINIFRWNEADRTWTCNLLLARQMLSHLSYNPIYLTYFALPGYHGKAQSWIAGKGLEPLYMAYETIVKPLQRNPQSPYRGSNPDHLFGRQKNNEEKPHNYADFWTSTSFWKQFDNKFDNKYSPIRTNLVQSDPIKCFARTLSKKLEGVLFLLWWGFIWSQEKLL